MSSILNVIACVGLASAPIVNESKFEKVADGLSFPEGPAWDGKSSLYVSNCKSDWILKLDNDIPSEFVKKETSPFNFGSTNGMAFGKDGYLYACDFGVGAIVRFDEAGNCEMVADGFEGKDLIVRTIWLSILPGTYISQIRTPTVVKSETEESS